MIRLSLVFAVALTLCGCVGQGATVDTRALLGEFRAEALTAEQVQALLRFAPILFQETSGDPTLTRRDFVTSFDYDGSAIAERPISAQDLHRSVFHALGLGAGHTNFTRNGRPIRAADKAGKIVNELFGA